jgi:hypothetical protein
MMEGEPFGEEALAFTKERVLQRDVEIKVDNVDKAGSMIGYDIACLCVIYRVSLLDLNLFNLLLINS